MLMELLDLENVLAGLKNIEVKFVPRGQCCKLRTRDLGQRVKIKPIESDHDVVDRDHENCSVKYFHDANRGNNG